VVIWPDKTYQTLKNVKTCQTLTVKADKNRKVFDYRKLHPAVLPILKKVETGLGIDFKHQENDFTDFLSQKLIPYQRSDRGPATAIGDLNGDGKDDIFFGGSKGKKAVAYIQNPKGFTKKSFAEIDKDSVFEDASAVIGDFNNDKINDLYVASGGGENASDLQDRLYVNKNNQLIKTTLPKLTQNASVVKTFDYDKDGDLDIFVANNSINNRFGSMPDCYLLNNNKGMFTVTESKTFEKIGMVTDAVFSDFNKDGKIDIVVVGEWMKPTFFANTKGKFVDVTTTVFPEKSNGLWQSVIPFDIDHDGDEDYLVGNWGMNSKFKASQDFPMKMYYDDFDTNGSYETIVAIEKKGQYFTTLGLDELAEQFSGMLKKKFNSYKSFAGKTLEEVFDPKMLEKGKLFEVHNLKSGYLKNDNGKFTFVPFSNKMQVAPITCFVKSNFDSDTNDEVFAAGNYFGVSPYHSRFDGFSGALIKNEKTILLGNQIGIDLTQKAVRHLDIVNFNGKKYVLVTINNKKAELYEMPSTKK
jgi:hypothetical protein